MAKLTPMMAQYNEIKAQYQDCILMYRLGDFYEMFFEDAVEASEILQITLTSRGKGGASETPMCGVPFHAVDGYLAKLTKAGKKVALADQVTAPTGKGIVEREVIRVVTPGTTFDEAILEGKANNFVGCVVRGGGAAGGRRFALAYSDITTGEFRVTEVAGRKGLETEMGKVGLAEVIGEEGLVAELAEFLQESGVCGFPFGGRAGGEVLKEYFGVQSLESFGLEGRELAAKACGVLFEYLKETQKTELKHLAGPVFYEVSEFMVLDEVVMRNLELFFTARDGKKEGSLVWVLDQTMTAMGGRMLRRWMSSPLLDGGQVLERQEKVAKYVADSGLMRQVREVLKGFYDMERLLSRLSLGTGNARDWGSG